MINEIYSGIYSIDIPLPGNPLKNLNSYLIKGTERSLLIDTGFNMQECLDAMNRGLDEIGVDLNKTDIFLTHLHSDHTGLAGHLQRERCRVYMNEIDLDLIHKFKEEHYWTAAEKRFVKLGFSEEELAENRQKNPAMIYLPSKEISYTGVRDGDTIELNGWKLKCIHTPGHTPGHTCLYDEERKILFSGDHVIFTISPNITSWNTMEDSLGSYLESLDKISSMDIKRTFSAHRIHEGDVYKRIEELKEHHLHRLEEALSIVEKMGKADVYTITSQMKWSIRAKNWQDFPVAQKWFATGEANAHLEHLRLLGKLKKTEENGVYYFML